MKQRVIDFLMGKQPQTAEVNPTSTYGADVDNFINALKEQPYMQKLYNAPIQERLSDEQIAEKVANGLNLGIPELAQAQKDVGIRIPQGTEQVAQAQLGEFNKPMVVAGINNAPREGGLIQGYKQGYNLNYDNPTNTVGTRIGQALGSIGRFADSSLGRGLIAYGLSNAMGDTNPLEQAFTAGVGRQTAVTKDKAYRQNLVQLGYTQDEIDSIPGIFTDDIYKNLVAAKQAEIMANYRNDMLKATQENQGIMNQIRLQTLANDEKQNAMQNYFKGQEIDLKRKDLEIKERNAGKNKAAFQKYRQAVKDRNDAIQQIKDLRTAIKANPNSLGLIVGSLAKGGAVSQKFANEQLSKNPESIKTRAAVAKLRGTTMHDLLGSAQTLTEQKNLVPFLPDATDNAKTALAKLDQLEKELLREQNSMNIYGNEMGWNYDDIQDEELQNLDPLGVL